MCEFGEIYMTKINGFNEKTLFKWDTTAMIQIAALVATCKRVCRRVIRTNKQINKNLATEFTD